MKVYLAGSVPKGDGEAKDFKDWRKEYTAIIRKSFPDFHPIDPNNVFAIEGDSLGVFGADCLWIQESDAVIVHGEKKLGAGTAMELIIAKYFKKPVITVLPKDTHHRRSNLIFDGRLVEDWIHPFIDVFSDIIVEKPEQLASAMKKITTMQIKGMEVIDEGVEYAKKLLKTM
jgi:hypothetical protein